MKFSFEPNEGLIVVHAQIRGPGEPLVARLALDTGATYTLINSAVLCLAGYDPSLTRDRYQMTTGSGIEFVPFVTVSHMEALGQRKLNFPIIAHTLPPSTGIDGLLGLDFLRDQELTIDFRKGTVILQ